MSTLIARLPLALVTCLALAAPLAACSEAASDGDGGGDPSSDGAGGGDDGSDDGDGDGDGDGDDATSGGSGGGGVGGGGALLVINEISAEGDDWIEILNAGDADADVSGLQIADDDAGAPKLDEAIVVPDGTILEPGAYLFVLADQDPAPTGFQEACDPGPAPCLLAPYGLSKDGDVVYLLDGAGEVLDQVEYVAGATADGQSWGRSPDATGDFAAMDPTPGAPNDG